MTCIVGLAENNQLWIGADSIGTRGNEALAMASPKVFRNGSFLFGCAGAPRHAHLLRSSAFNPPKQKDKQSDLDYLSVDVVAHIRALFSEHGALRQRDVKTDEHDSEFLIGYGGRIWELESNFQIIDSLEPYMAAGCGRQYAKGVLSLLHHDPIGKKLTARFKIERALREAERHDPYVQRPFHILSMKARAAA